MQNCTASHLCGHFLRFQFVEVNICLIPGNAISLMKDVEVGRLPLSLTSFNLLPPSRNLSLKR